MKFLQINPKDNVAVALEDLEPRLCGGTTLLEPVARGHKFALRDIEPGEQVIKYGMPIGHATQFIAKGAHVHIHNMHTNLEGTLEYSYSPANSDFQQRECTQTFLGYQRKNGSVGVRNNLFVIPTVGCVNKLAERLVQMLNCELPDDCDRAIALTHPYGCSQLGEDHRMTQAILAGHALHPNAGGVLVLGLGCENNTIASFKALLGDYDPKRIRFLVAQEAQDEYAEGLAQLRELATIAAQDRRSPIPMSRLVIGLKCGGSDGLSGITANALVGRFSDRLASYGGSTILSEVPEMFGAETLLMERCRDKRVFQKCVDMINGFKDYFSRHKQPIYENPSPGNKAGGISTLEDKSLGCTQKAGCSPVVDVLAPGKHPGCPGLNLVSGPGNDMVATTNLTACGAHIVLFTTGRGTPFGGVVPTIKVASNTSIATRKPQWIDFNAGVLVEDGTSPAVLDDAFFNLILETASGKLARNERNGFQEIAIFKDGVTL